MIWLVDFMFYFQLNSYGHMESEQWFIVSSDRSKKLGIKPGLQSKWLNHYATEADLNMNFPFIWAFSVIMSSHVQLR